MSSNYGSVQYCGKRYTLTEDAYVSNCRDGVRYYAHAVDESGEPVIVAWDTTAEWDAAEAEARKMGRQYAPSAAPDDEYPALLYDESNACDWEHPAEVTPV